MQITLSNTNQILDLQTTVAGSIHYSCGYVDLTSTTVSNPTDVQGIITTATITNIVTAPATSTTRKIQFLNVYNNGVTNTVRIIKDIAGTDYILIQTVLRNNETLRIVNDQVVILDASGLERKQNGESLLGSDSRTIYKIGTTTEATGVMYCFSKDTGFPGAWSPGTPGINGRNTDGTTASDAGSINNGNPASGQYYLRDFDISSSATGQINIFDILWVNTGLVVTTTTAQAITQPVLPARDNDGTTNGYGVQAGILVTTATTNASAITNITLSYTNSDGVSGKTATISSFPTTAVAGTFVPFQLSAGDKGIRSIQSITLGTSLVTGAISLLCFENLMSKGNTVANSGSSQFNKVFDVPLFNGHCLIPFVIPSSVSAYTINGNLYFVNK